MADLYDGKLQGILKISSSYIKDLTEIWSRIFDEDMVVENLCKLTEHVKVFYDDLIAESLEKQRFAEREIAELQQEAEMLQRVLKTNVVLPVIDNPNIPLLVLQAEMDKSISDLRECLRQRREEICELLLEQEGLCEELGESPRELLADPLPTAGEIEDFRQSLEQLKQERIERINRLSMLRREIRNYLQILDLKVSSEVEDRLLNYRQIKLNKETFAGLLRMRDCYGSQVEEMRERIEGLRKKLETIWPRLNTSPATRNKFKRCTENSQRTYEVLAMELQRCETLRKQNIQQYVDQIRHEIVQLWDKTLKSQLERNRFSHFYSNNYTEDLLTMHEMEMEDLIHYHETNKQIFELYDNRKLLWDRMNALEAKASDPNRYNNRGGQLLKEEKERKTIASKLPKIEQQITELVQAYEEREHSPFLVHGENIIELMASEWEKKRQEKEKMSSARKNGQTPLSRSQLMSNRTPLSVKNASINPSTTTVSALKSSQKRKLNPAEVRVPVAKRNLLQSLNSPSVFLKPSAAAKKPTLSAQKSPTKRARVIATTIRRKSGRQSAGKKRRSLNKTTSSANKNTRTRAVPRIAIDSGSEECSDNINDDAYESFQKCIEPDSRSSIIQSTYSSHSSTMSLSSTRSRRMQYVAAQANARKAYLPAPRILRTPSKQNQRERFPTPTANHRTSPMRHHSPAGSAAGSGRKLTTKNLPIII